MKLLMFDTNEFWYKPFIKTVEHVVTADKEEGFADSLVIFVNVETEDEVAPERSVRKAVDNICWLAKKTGRTKVILHSFAHLSESKATIESAESTLEKLKEKLDSKGLATSVTPFGYLLEFKIHVKGESLAKVWKSI